LPSRTSVALSAAMYRDRQKNKRIRPPGARQGGVGSRQRRDCLPGTVQI